LEVGVGRQAQTFDAKMRRRKGNLEREMLDLANARSQGNPVMVASSRREFFIDLYSVSFAPLRLCVEDLPETGR
jgi:hypothetical protein